MPNYLTRNVLNIIATATLVFSSLVVEAYYTEPTRRTVLNEVIDPAVEDAVYPLYLSDAGRYYAELYLTGADGETANTHQQPISLKVEIDFVRKGKLLRSENAIVEFKPGEANKLIFWARAPFDLPQRKGMDVNVSIEDLNGNIQAGDAQNVRLQITRKFEFGPIFRY